MRKAYAWPLKGLKMKLSIISVVSAGVLLVATLSTADAAFFGRLETAPGTNVFQAYYDDQLNITWTADANLNGSDTWDNQQTWAMNLTINGVGDWRLPNLDVNNNGDIIDCTTGVPCMDNEYGHLMHYGGGTVEFGGIQPSSEFPFSNVQSSIYWSGNELPNPLNTFAMGIEFKDGVNSGTVSTNFKTSSALAWAVRDGDVPVSAVPTPSAKFLMASGLIGLVGWRWWRGQC